MGSGRPTKYKAEMCDKLIEMSTKGKSVSAFCAEVGISRETFYHWGRQNKIFSDTIKRAKALSEKYWEELAEQNMVLEGSVKFNSTAWIFIMKNRFGWRDTPKDEESSDKNDIKINIDNDDNSL